ncbi:putative coiled-coil protein SlyX [Bradyrhizobium sp. USDA 4341]
MIDQTAIDSASLEDLVDLKERVEKKIADRMAAERADLEKRQASLAKLTERIEKGPKALKKPATAKKTEKDSGKGADGDGKAAEPPAGAPEANEAAVTA